MLLYQISYLQLNLLLCPLFAGVQSLTQLHLGERQGPPWIICYEQHLIKHFLINWSKWQSCSLNMTQTGL